MSENQQPINVNVVMPKSHWFRNLVILVVIFGGGYFIHQHADYENKSITIADYTVRWTENGIRFGEMSFPQQAIANIDKTTTIVNDTIVKKPEVKVVSKPVASFKKDARKDKSLDGYTVEEIAEATFRSNFANAVEAQIIRLRSSYDSDGRFAKMKPKDLKRLEVQMRYIYHTRTIDQLRSYAYSQTTYSMTEFGTVMLNLLPFDEALNEALSQTTT